MMKHSLWHLVHFDCGISLKRESAFAHSKFNSCWEYRENLKNIYNHGSVSRRRAIVVSLGVCQKDNHAIRYFPSTFFLQYFHTHLSSLCRTTEFVKSSQRRNLFKGAYSRQLESYPRCRSQIKFHGFEKSIFRSAIATVFLWVHAPIF